MNSLQAFPSLKVQCQDRTRDFCLNLGAFRALEEYMTTKTGNSEYSITTDFPWESTRMSDEILIIWAGFYTDAQNDSEPWTVEKAGKVVDLLGLVQTRKLIQESLARILTPEQVRAQQKKTLKKKKA